MANETRKKLFNALNDAGFDIGGYDDFDRRMNNQADRKKFYDAVSEAGYDIGDYNSFDKRIAPSKYKLNIKGVATPVSEKQYRDFTSRNPGKTSAQTPSVYEKAKAKAQMPTTPWSYEQAKTKQTATPSKAQTPAYDLSRPQMTQQDILSGQSLINAVEKQREAVRNVPDRVTGDYEMEQMRKRQPIAKTNTPADQYVVKTQGQWEDELSKNVDELVNEPIANDVDKAIAQADADYMNTLRANQQIGVPSEAAPLWGLMTEGAANRQRDPEKVLSGLVENAQQRYQEYFSQPETLDKIKRQADTMGLTPDDYVNKVVLPQIEGRMKEQFEKTEIARNMPSGHVEYLLRGLGDSIVGTLATQLATAPGHKDGKTMSQRQFMQAGDEAFRQQRGGGFMGGVEDAARMGVSLAADAPILKGFGTAAGLSTKGIASTKYGGKILGDMGLRSAARYANASVAQRALMNIPSSMLSGAINLGLYEGTSNVVNNISVGEDTSLGNSLKLFAEGFEHGAVTGGVLGMFGAMTKGLGSNIGIKAGDTGATKVLHGAEKALYEAGALGVEGMGFHTADQINKFLSGEETDKDAGEFLTGTLDGAVMAGMLKLTSAHNAEKAIRGIGSGKAVSQFKDGLTRFLSADASDLRLTDVDRKALSFLGDVDQVMKNVRTADDAAGIYKEVMENPKVPFSTKQKFSAMTVGTMSASKPIWNALYLLEDNTVETVKRVIDEQGNVHEQVIDRFEFNDKDDYKAKLQELNDERENQIMRNGYALHTQMLVQQMPGLREKVLEKFGYSPELGDDNPANQRVIESVSRGGQSEQAFNDAMRELVSQGVKIEDPLLKSFAQEYGMGEDEVLKVINKDFRDYTPEEADMMRDFGNRVWEDLYPANEPHPMQSMERGQMLADQAEVGQVVNTEAVQQLSEKYLSAKQAYDAYLDSMSIKPEELAGMSYPEQVDYIRNNFSDERAERAKDVILPLWDAELQNKGFFERLRQRTEEAADSVASEMEFKGTVDGNKEGWVVYTIRDNGGNEYTLKGGDAVFTEDGRIDPEKSSQLIIALDAEGHPVSLSSSSGLTVASRETKDERRARMLEEIQNQTTEEYLANGGLGDLVGQQLNVDPRKVQQQETAQPPLKEQQGAQPAVEAGQKKTGANEAAATAPVQAATESQQALQGETTTPPSAEGNGIPLSKNGRTKEYHLVEPDVAIDDILQRDNSKVSWNNDPSKVADSYLKAAQKSLDELNKKNKSLVKRAKEEDFDPEELDDITNGTENTDMGKYFARKAEIQEKMDYYNGLKEEWNRRHPVVEDNQLKSQPVVEEDPSIRDAIVKEKTTLKSKWNALHKLYDGTAADDGEILDESRPLDVQELVAMNMPRGIAWSSYEIDGTHKVKGLSEELGFDKKRRIGKDTNTSGFNTFLAKKGTGISIDEVVHRIWESGENELPDGEKRFDDTDIRNAVIAMFRNAERPSDITNYVVNNRSRLANERLEQERRYEEEAKPQPTEKEGGNEIADEKTEQDDYLKPRNEKEKEIVADVEKKLSEDIKAAEEEVRKAKSALEKAQVKESDKATDLYANDNAFNKDGQIFDNSEMPVDQTIEGVERRTEAERERLMEAEAKLENLQSEAEHDSRVRGALDNERRQTTLEAAAEPQPSVNEEGKSAGSIQSDMPFAPAENDYVPFQKVEEPKPVGTNRFGGIYNQFKGKVKEAFDFLLRKKDGYLQAVFHRDDLGDIDLAWGSAPTDFTGKGLAHIIRKHINVMNDFKNIDEAMRIIEDVINNGEAKPHPKDPQLVNIEKGDYRVVIAKNAEGNWVLTAFDFVNPKKEKIKGKTLPPSKTPGQSDVEAGAVTSNLSLSESKDTKNDNTTQENQQKVAKINTSDPIEAIEQAANSFKESKLTKMEKTIRDGVINLMRKVGIDVSTDWEEGQKILDEHNERVKAQKDSSPIFTSNAQRAVESIKQEKATPEQWLKMIEKNGGLKAGEDKWMGLSEWLKGQDKKSLTKQEVLDFIRENQIQIEEANYQEHINLDDNPQMQEFRTEFDDIVKKLEDEKESVEQEANAFNDEMYQKYGEGWANDPDRLSKKDQRRNDEMIERWQKLNDEDTRELAFREMVEKYGDDFEMAFEYNPGNGQLEPQMDMYGDNISDAAKHFLQLDEQPINSTRLSYTTQGLDNKKEIALVVPTVESWNEGDEIHFGDAGNGRAVAWVRFGETTDADGKKVLVIDEIQSKRHQEGREKGYRKELPPYTEDMLSVVENDGFWEIGEDLGGGNVRNLNYYSTEMMSREEAVSEYIKTHERVKPGIPDAPFDKNWHELAMKRMLRYAAENGYDKVAWTKGEQQADRYSLSKAFDSVEREDNPSVKGRRFVFIGRNVENFVVDDEGKVIDSTISDSKGKNLSELVGKDMAVKMMALENGDIIEDGLRVGGEGMKGFYDQMLPRFMDKYGKKWGVKTGEVELPNVEEAGRKMWSVDVTPEMKESVMQGQPMFFKTKDGQAYGFVKDGKIYIDPRIATAETPVHEYTHLWAEGVRRADAKKWKEIVKTLKTDEAVKPLWEKIKKDYPELKNDDARAEEILSQYSGKRGAERLRAEAEKIQEEQGEESAKTFMQKIKQALTDFWKSVAQKFGRPFTSAEDIADMVMKDLMAGKNPNEWREKSLMGVHNVSEEKLRKILKQGGLANPSLAVIDTNHNSHTDYGEISLIPKSDLIDSKRGGNAGTWTADAWTPTYPQVVKRMSKKGEKVYDKDLQKAIPGRENSAVRSQMNIRFEDYLENGRSPEGLALWYLAEKGLNPEIVKDDRGNFDYYTTINKAREQFKGHEEEFKKWLEEKEAAYGVEEYLWNGTDNQGRNKWVKNTLENASRLMKKQGRAGAVNWSGTGSMIATVAKRLKTKEQINKSKENLSATKEDYDAFHEKWGDELYRLSEVCGDGDAWYGEARLQEALGENNPAAYLEKEYGVKLSDEDKQSMQNFINEVQNTFPARYFETKFERPVGLGEFEIAVVPSTTSPDIVEALKKAGLDVRTYEKGNDVETNDQNWRKATMDAVRDRDDIMFQLVGEKGASAMDEAEKSTSRMDNKAVAEEMEEAGKDSKTIWMATGWEKGKDGKWRYEIPDFKEFDPAGNVEYRKRNPLTSEEKERALQLNTKKIDAEEGVGEPLTEEELQEWAGYKAKINPTGYEKEKGFLSDFIDAPELFAAYPKLKDMVVEIDDLGGEFSGMYTNEDTIVLDKNYINKALNGNEVESLSASSELKDTMVHEIQHAIQEIEGFALGDNPHRLAGDKEIGDDAYYRSAGEVEARNVERRRLMGSGTRKKRTPESTEDTKRDEQEAYMGYDPMEAIEKNAARFKQEQNDGIYYRKGAEEKQPVENRAVVEGHVTTLKSKLGEKVQMANSVDEIDNEKVRKKIENGEKVMGWYDTKSDSVHLYMPNIPNSYEAEKTIWHETVGHKGMRQLLGEEGYKRYMMKIWMDDKNTELGDYVKERLTKNGFNAYEAINEWLAQKAEEEVKNPYQSASMWQKVRESMSDGLRKAGYRMSPSIMDVKYMTWLSEQNKKGKVSEAAKRKMMAKLMNERYDTNNYGQLAYRANGESDFDTDFRIQNGNGNTPIAALARDRYRNAIYDKFFPWDESHRDYMAAWRHAQEAIANGRNIPDHANALMLENEMDSKMKAMGDIYVRDLCMPAQEAMNECLAKLNVDKPEEAYMVLNDYMYQKVGLQVNRQMYVRDWLRDQRKKGKDVDAVESEWYALKADLKQKVDQGRITLRDYYTELDQWIADNVKRKKRVTDAQGNIHVVDAPFVADEHDASGLTAFAGSADGKTYDDGAILDRVMNMENQLGRDSANKLWEKMRMITDFALETEYAGGIVNKESIDAARAQYDWYIPLRGFDETTAEDMWTYLNRYGGKGMLGQTLVSRKGRRSEAEDPIATAFMMGEQAIRRAARNQVKQAALRFARQFSDPTDPNSLLTETDVWVKNESADPNNPDWVVQYPAIKPNAKPHEVAQAVAQFNQDMETLSQAGLAKRIKNAKKDNIPYRFANDRNVSEHIIEAKVNGDSKLIVFNDNPRAAQAINGQLKPKATTEILARINRMMSQAYTSWAPTFIVRNAVRDAEFASSMLSVKEGWGYCGDFMKNYLSLTVPGAGEKKKPEIFELFMKHRRGTLDENKPIEKMFKEFIENGGVTGYTQENNIEKWHNDIVKSFKDAGKKNAGKNAVKWFFEGVEKMNESVENAARFATYMTSRQAGRTVIRSVADAKEVSVNFNRKGAGWKTSTFKNEKGQTNMNAKTAAFTGQYLRDTSLFYNATVQGISNSMGNAQLATTRFMTRFAIPPFVFGALVPLLNQWIHNTFDPDDGSVSDNPYADLPEWDRRSNFCIYLGNNNFFKIPLSLEHKAFYGIGDIAAGATYDERLKSVDKPFFVDVADCLSTFSPVDYTDTEIGMKGATGRVAGLLVPAAAKPLVQAANNTSWTGKKIQKESKFNDENTPEYLKAYEGKTSKLMVDAFDVWHQIWGGNDVERAGKRENWATSIFGNSFTENVGELSPAKTQYWLEQQFGETGKMALSLGSGLYDAGKAAVTGGDIFDEPDWNIKMVPGVKAFFTQGNEQQQFYRARTKYFHYQDQLKDTEYASREYKKQSATDPMKAVEQQAFEKERRYKQYQVYKTTFKKDLDKLYKQIKEEKDPKKRKALKEQQNILMKNCVDALDKIE